MGHPAEHTSCLTPVHCFYRWAPPVAEEQWHATPPAHPSHDRQSNASATQPCSAEPARRLTHSPERHITFFCHERGSSSRTQLAAASTLGVAVPTLLPAALLGDAGGAFPGDKVLTGVVDHRCHPLPEWADGFGDNYL